MKRRPLNVFAHVVGLITVLSIASAIYACWLVAGWAKADVLTRAKPDDLFLQALLTTPTFFLIGLLAGIVGTAISLEGYKSGQAPEDSKPSTNNGRKS